MTSGSHKRSQVKVGLYLMSECIALTGGHTGLWEDSLHILTYPSLWPVQTSP